MSPSPAPHSPPHENASRDQPVQPSIPAKTDLVEMKRITVDHHIKLLRQYNDVRDIATGLMGIMAEHRQLPMKRIYQDLGLDEKD
ncbi:MAG: hypothetical protein L6R37_001538 [Teloschistes peruensis]|nr:MAG: hypothetical protein L6R37_001538 [Teloschistes peruensis]